MTNVIAFDLDRKTRPTTERGSDEVRIILFTGVRYIRAEADEEPSFAEAEAATEALIEAGGERLQA